MGFLERAIRRGVSDAVGKAIGKAIEPTVTDLTNKAANAIDQAAQNAKGESIAYSAQDSTNNVNLLQLVKLSAGANEVNMLEEQYRQGDITASLCLKLLSAYSQSQSLTGAQEKIRNDIVTRLAAAQVYNGSVEENTGLTEAAVTRLLESKAKAEVQYNCVDLIAWAQVGDTLGGGVSGEIMRRALELAKKFPNEIAYQYLIIYFLDGYPVRMESDEAKEIAACVNRYDTLYREKLMEKESKEEYLLHLKALTGIYFKLGYNARATDYALAAAEETGDKYLAEQVMYGYFMQAKGEECLNYAKTLLEKDKNDFIALGYAGRGAMLADDYETVVDCGVRLADIAKESDDTYADYMLYQFVSYLTVKDDWYGTGGRFPGAACYHDLSEAQLAKIKGNEYLNAYIEAFAAATGQTVVEFDFQYSNDDYWQKALEKTNALVALKDNAGFPHYIKGMALYGDERYEEAIQEYSKALSYQPNEHYIWYSLASCFEEIGDLQNAHQAVQVSLDIIPSNVADHTHDWTGVSLHAEGMLERVRRELLEGEG